MAEELGTKGAAQQNPEGGEDQKGKTAEGESTTVSMTKEELEAKLQSEADKRVSAALKTAQSKWQADYEKKLADEKREAEKLATLSSTERQRVLDEKRERDLADRERTIYKKELELTAVKILDGKKLPVHFAHLLLGDNAEETHSNIEEFEKNWHAEIEKNVGERLKGITPKSAQPGERAPTMNDIIRGVRRK